MAYLVLVRHGESEWNALSLWTGWTDVSLTEKGRGQARTAGKQIADLHFDLAYTSVLKRAKETWSEIRKENHWENVQTVEDKALNERNYGDLTGKNKWKIKEEYGEEQFNKWRRGWDIPLLNGESLKNVYERVLPYYNETILPNLEAGKNVIVVAHGNSLRALIKYLDNISDDKIADLELNLSEPYVYQIGEKGNVLSKEVRSIGTKAP